MDDAARATWYVTGAGGMLGSDVVSVLRDAGHDVVGLTRAELDVRDPRACQEALAGAGVVVNAAGWTDVDGAEDAEAAAFSVNAVGAANVARAAAGVGAALVHVSTDYVFAGDATVPYAIDHPIEPCNAYGRTKAAGEWAVLAACPDAYVVRTAWLYGEGGPNFVQTVLRLAERHQTVDVVDDQRGQPTWTRDLAVFVTDLVLARAPAGLHHGTASGDTTWFGFAREVFILAGLDPDRVRPTTSAAYPRRAPRPAYSVLDNDGRLPHWQDALSRAIPALVAVDADS
jgi:dTDP-4-dehydrorhamnose reductase